MKAILRGNHGIELTSETENEFAQLVTKSDSWDSQLIEPDKIHPFGALWVHVFLKPDQR